MKFNGLPENADVMTQVCPITQIDVNQLGVWRKNPSATMVFMLCIGAGGPGSAGAASTGGSGGGSGGQTSLLIPAVMVPDTLWFTKGVRNPQGGIVCVTRDAKYLQDVQNNTMSFCAARCAQSGATSGTVASTADFPLGAGGIFKAFAGQNGAAGGAATANGTSVTYPTTGLLVTGGAGGGGGGGSAGNGGSITASSPRPVIPGGVSARPVGSSGVSFVGGAFLPSGGGGGYGAIGIAAAFDGGAGGIGCGGGGGGGVSGGAVGAGGNGGPGLIVIAQW